MLPRYFTRFRIPWRWDGQPVVLQRWAGDETGAVQPTRAALIAQHGRHGNFHYNAIVSCAINEQVSINHVYVDADKAENDGDDLLESDWDF